MREKVRSTAAWRISIWTTIAFAVGTAIAFWVVYAYVSRGIREHIDTWLSGEAEVLAQVAANTPRDALYDRLVEEVAELAAHEVPEDRDAHGNEANSVFFFHTGPPASAPIWFGPEPRDQFIAAITQAQLAQGIPQAVTIGGTTKFRVVVQRSPRGDLYLGLSDRDASLRLHQLTLRFLLTWAVVAMFGFLISYLSTRRTLSRVDDITETVSRIGTEDLSARLPEPSNSDEISRLARTFNRMLARIQSSISQLRTVTDAVAHDLKSPLTSIRGRLEAALLAEDDQRRTEAIGEAIEALDRVSAVLNTTLDLAEAEAGALKMERAPVDLSQAVRTIVELYRPAMTERDQRLVVDLQDNVVIGGDGTLINRVLSNLLENELVHVPTGCEVRIHLYSQHHSAEMVIEDTGPGFPPDLGSRAFERFVKGKHSPGHGLGLAFVDSVVQLHGGSIRVSERPGGGALIALSFPLAVLQPA